MTTIMAKYAQPCTYLQQVAAHAVRALFEMPHSPLGQCLHNDYEHTQITEKDSTIYPHVVALLFMQKPM